MSLEMKKCCERLENNGDFILFMKAVKDICGYELPTIFMDMERRISTEGMIYNEARRSVYLDLRKCMTDRLLNTIEKRGV